MEILAQYGVAGILIVLVLKEVLPFVARRSEKTGSLGTPKLCDLPKYEVSLSKFQDNQNRQTEILEEIRDDIKADLEERRRWELVWEERWRQGNKSLHINKSK